MGISLLLSMVKAVYMRRKQRDKALGALQKAEALMPQVAGIRLNTGLASYRQNEFLKAIPRFESMPVLLQHGGGVRLST